FEASLRREAGAEQRAGPGRGVHEQLSPEQIDALLYSEQPESLRVCPGLKAISVIANAQLNCGRVRADLDDRASRLAMLGGVRQGLLHDPVERRLQLGPKPHGRAAVLRGELDVQVDLHAAAAGPFDETFERGLYPEFVQRRWSSGVNAGPPSRRSSATKAP